MRDSNLSAKRGKGSSEKPAKPRPDFPLFPHATGRWAKKHKGTFFYFGPWDDPQGAEAAYWEWRAVYIEGKPPRPVDVAGPTVADLCNRYLTGQQRKLDAGEITERSWADNQRTTDTLIDVFGPHRPVSSLRPSDFSDLLHRFSKRSFEYRANIVTRTRSVFKYAYDTDLITHPIKFGPDFTKPSSKAVKRAKAKQLPKTFTAAEAWRLLQGSEGQLRAMIWLGLNCGLGPSDCGQLELRHLDLEGGWLDYPRPKTGEPRRAKLWTETITAIREAVKIRPKAKRPDLEPRVFLTRCGESWHKEIHDTPIANEFGKLTKRLGLQQKGRGFYGLRHTFATVASQGGDLVAVSIAMGHAPNGITQGYIDRDATGQARLAAIAQRVREWLGEMVTE